MTLPKSLLTIATIAHAFYAVSCAAPPPALAPSANELRAPLSRGGEPIGDVAGDLELYVSADRRFVRYTAHKPGVVVHLDRTGAPPSPHGASARSQTRAAVDLGDGLMPDRFELCFDHPLVPVALRSHEAAPAPATVTLHERAFTVDTSELCFADGDVEAPFVLVVAHWDAPDATRIFIEGGSDGRTPTRMWSEPPRSNTALLDALLFRP